MPRKPAPQPEPADSSKRASQRASRAASIAQLEVAPGPDSAAAVVAHAFAQPMPHADALPHHAPSLDDPSLYVNREMSLLEFQKRVLEEARDPRNKLLERVKFLSIVTSNIDEMFMVRIAALKQKLSAGSPDLSIDGKTVSQQLALLRPRLVEAIKATYDCFHRLLVPGLMRHGLEIAAYADLDPVEKEAVDRYYQETIFPVLTPLALDTGRPFPHISNLSLNLAVVLEDTDGRQHFARLKIPQQLPPLVTVPGSRKKGPAFQVCLDRAGRSRESRLLVPGSAHRRIAPVSRNA